MRVLMFVISRNSTKCAHMEISPLYTAEWKTANYRIFESIKKQHVYVYLFTHIFMSRKLKREKEGVSFLSYTFLHLKFFIMGTCYFAIAS